MSLPSRFNPKADFAWDEAGEKSADPKKREAEFRRLCDQYGLEPLRNPPHDNERIRRYLLRARQEVVREWQVFWPMIEHKRPPTRVREITRSYIVHPDHSFTLSTSISFWRIPIPIRHLKANLIHDHQYRTINSTEIRKWVQRNRLQTISVEGVIDTRVAFIYNIPVLQPLWLPKQDGPWSRKSVAGFIETELWYPIAMAHRLPGVKLRPFL